MNFHTYTSISSRLVVVMLSKVNDAQYFLFFTYTNAAVAFHEFEVKL